MPVNGGVAILVGCGAVGTPVVGFIPVAAVAGVASIFACHKSHTDKYGVRAKVNYAILYFRLYFQCNHM